MLHVIYPGEIEKTKHKTVHIQ